MKIPKCELKIIPQRLIPLDSEFQYTNSSEWLTWEMQTK